MITRYEDAKLRELFDPQAYVDRWTMCEKALAKAQAARDTIPIYAARAISAVTAPTWQAVRTRESITRHDIAAFVQLMEERVNALHVAAAPDDPHGNPGRYVHFRATSSDIVDTANAIMLEGVCDVLSERAEELLAAIAGVMDAHSSSPMIGRTHGQPAQRTSFGARLGVLWARVNRAYEQLEQAKHEVTYGKFLGPIGDGDQEINIAACQQLGLSADNLVTQVVQRDRYLAWAFACLRLVLAAEDVATQIRLLSQSGIDEVAEYFNVDQQVGSSSMPHKRNPVRSERVCGLARIARGLFQSFAEGTVLWGERDISNSSQERVAVEDLAHLTAFCLSEMAAVVRGLRVDAVRMRSNADRAEAIMGAAQDMETLIERGHGRAEAHRIARRISGQ